MEIMLVIALIAVYFFYNKKQREKQKQNAHVYCDKILATIRYNQFKNEDKQLLSQFMQECEIDAANKNWAEKEALSQYMKSFIIDDMLDPSNVHYIKEALDFVGNQEIANAALDPRFFNMLTANWYMFKEGKVQSLPISMSGVVTARGESVLFWNEAKTKRYKTSTKKINFSGPVVSINIIKGVRYKAGSLNFDRKTITELVTDDTGILYLTNKRIFFKGQKTNISIEYKNLSSIEITEAGLTLGRKTAKNLTYIELPAYEFPATLIAFMLDNPNAEVVSQNN